MTRDKLIELAKQAGFQADSFGIGIWDSQDFSDFARLVEEHEREECAQLVNRANEGTNVWVSMPWLAEQIRARKPK